jgi:hypothetical protein
MESPRISKSRRALQGERGGNAISARAVARIRQPDFKTWRHNGCRIAAINALLTLRRERLGFRVSSTRDQG